MNLIGGVDGESDGPEPVVMSTQRVVEEDIPGRAR